MCPHANEIWADARYDGKVLSCHHYEWEFDRTTGDCIKGKPCKLAEFAVEIKDGELARSHKSEWQSSPRARIAARIRLPP
jgi:nitrite reductase/ring-hydroxylating ferredoxin subunit